MRVIRYILLLVFILGAMLAFSQSDLLFNNLNINNIARNPASIQNNDAINAYFGAHQQWVGFEDAPNMQWAHVSTFFDNLNMGVSLNVTNQSVGATLTQNIKLGYAYHIYFKGGHSVSLGVGAGLYFRRFDLSKLRFEENEQNIPVSDENITKPDFDFGIEYYYSNLTVGIVANHITISNNKATVLKIPLQNHIYANYSIVVKDDFTLIPGIDFHNSGTITSYGVSFDFRYSNIFNVGVGYRLESSLLLRAGVKLSPVFYVEYAYDMGAGSFKSYNSGVHEIVISARFKKRNQSFNSPRFID